MLVDDLINSVDSLADTVFGGIDSLSTTDEEKLKLRNELQKQFSQIQKAALKVKEKQIEAKAGIIKAAKETPFWKNWRGLVMLGVFVLAVLHAVMPEVAYFSSTQITTLLKWGLGGYIGVEGALGIARHGAPAVAERERRKAQQEREKTRRYRAAKSSMRSYEPETPEMRPGPPPESNGPETVTEARNNPKKADPAPPEQVGW